MVGMIVVGAMGDDDVGLPFADEPRDRLPVLERRLELAVVIVQDLEVVSDEPGPVLDLGLAPPGQRRAGFLPVADIAVRHGNELDVIPFRDPQGGRPGRVRFGVVRVGPDDEDPRLSLILRRRPDGGEGERPRRPKLRRER